MRFIDKVQAINGAIETERRILRHAGNRKAAGALGEFLYTATDDSKWRLFEEIAKEASPLRSLFRSHQ